MERGTFTPAELKLLVDTADTEWKLLITLGQRRVAIRRDDHSGL